MTDKYKQFFEQIWTDYCNQGLDMDVAELVLNTALKLGLAKETTYDPAIHGEYGADEFGCEKGDPWYEKATE